jgi:hypothetical protein
MIEIIYGLIITNLISLYFTRRFYLESKKSQDVKVPENVQHMMHMILNGDLILRSGKR